MVSSVSKRKIIFVVLDLLMLITGLAMVISSDTLAPVEQLNFLDVDVGNTFLMHKTFLLMGYICLLFAGFGVYVFWHNPEFYIIYATVLLLSSHFDLFLVIYFYSKNELTSLEVLVEVMAIAGSVTYFDKKEKLSKLIRQNMENSPADNYYFDCCGSSEQPVWTMIFSYVYCCRSSHKPPCDFSQALHMKMCDNALLVYLWKKFRFLAWGFVSSLCVKCLIIGLTIALYYSETREITNFENQSKKTV